MNFLQKNIGRVDSRIRIGTGVILCACAAFGFLGAWAWIGIIPLATGFMKTCPIYTLVNKDTLEK